MRRGVNRLLQVGKRKALRSHGSEIQQAGGRRRTICPGPSVE
jgi:hypothetical protein